MAKNTGKVREFCQSGKVGTLIIEMIFHMCSRIVCAHGYILSQADTNEINSHTMC